jgi:hypothetical protein
MSYYNFVAEQIKIGCNTRGIMWYSKWTIIIIFWNCDKSAEIMTVLSISINGKGSYTLVFGKKIQPRGRAPSSPLLAPPVSPPPFSSPSAPHCQRALSSRPLVGTLASYNATAMRPLATMRLRRHRKADKPTIPLYVHSVHATRIH